MREQPLYLNTARYPRAQVPDPMETSIKQYIAARCPLPVWVRRLGVAGFLFFLVKGLLWLTVPGLLVFFGLSD